MKILRNTCAAIVSAVMLGTFLPAGSAHADASVLGLEMGKSTVSALKNKFEVESQGINQWSRGEMYSIDTAGIPIDGIKNALAIFNTDGKLDCVLLTIQKHRFDELSSSLQKKYKVTKKVKPFVGDSYVHFKDGNTLIELDAPHMSFAMTLIYMQEDFKKSFKTGVKAEEDQKRQAESDVL